MWSREAKKIILIKLTILWEDACDRAFKRKKSKYQDLQQDYRENRWQACLFPVKVGCREFPAQSVWRMLIAIGMTGKWRKIVACRLGRQQKEPLAGYGTSGRVKLEARRRWAWIWPSLPTCHKRVLRFSVETPEEHWTLFEDIMKAAVSRQLICLCERVEASSDVFSCKEFSTPSSKKKHDYVEYYQR